MHHTAYNDRRFVRLKEILNSLRFLLKTSIMVAVVPMPAFWFAASLLPVRPAWHGLLICTPTRMFLSFLFQLRPCLVQNSQNSWGERLQTYFQASIFWGAEDRRTETFCLLAVLQIWRSMSFILFSLGHNRRWVVLMLH